MRTDLIVVHPDPDHNHVVKRLNGLGKAEAASETEFWTRLGYRVVKAWR